MNARSPDAFFLSLLIHGLVVSAFLISAYAFKDSAKEMTQEFQVVAGPGNDYGATEAPPLGVPGGAKIDFPSPAPVTQKATPTPPAPEPVATPPAAVPPTEAVTAPPAAKEKPLPATTPDFSKQIKRTEDRTMKRNLAKYNKERAEAERKAAEAEKKAAEAERKKLTYEDFMKQQKGSPSPKPSNSQTKIARIDPSGFTKGLQGGKGESQGAGGNALSRGEQDLLDTYFAALKLRLKEAHEKPMGVSDLLHATAEFFIAADGSISQVRISRSSGNAEFDQSVLAAFRGIPAMGRRPDGNGDTRSVEFQMKEEG